MNGLRRVSLAVCSTLGVLVGVLVFSAPALAVLAYGPITGHIGNPGVAGSGNGEFSGPDGVAVDQSSHDVYVVDRANNRVEKFSASGVYLSQFNGSEVPGGPFLSPSAVAVDPSTGEVYVADSGHNVVDKFTSVGVYVLGSQLTGQPALPFSNPDGLAVDPTSGDLYVADHGNALVDVFTASGGLKGHFSTEPEGPWSLATDSSGHVYVAMPGAEQVTEYTALGAVVRVFREFIAAFYGRSRTVGVDLQTNDAFLGTEIGPEGERVYQLEEVSPSGEPTAQSNFGGEGKMSNPREASPGIAVDSTSGTVYAVDINNDVVDIFALVNLPTVETGPSSEVKGATAKVSGRVNPEGIEAHYFYEYGPCKNNEPRLCHESPYTEKTPVEPLEEPAGIKPEPANALLSGLIPETTYHYRLVAENTNGEKRGLEENFTTGPAVAGVHTTEATQLKTTSATLNGQLNPEGALTFYRFEYGPCNGNNLVNCSTSAYTIATEFTETESPSEKQVTAPITELKPGTIYHYLIDTLNISIGLEHGFTNGQEETFTTLPEPATVNDQAPYVTGISPSEATLHGTINPGEGNTTYHFQYGPTTTYESTTPETHTQLNNNDDPVETPITGLQPNTTYHYRLIATNLSGPGGTPNTTTGPDQTFTTLTPPTTETNKITGPPLEVAPTPGITQPTTPPLLPTPPYPAIKPVKPPPPTCKKGFIKKNHKCIRKKTKKTKKAKKHRK